MKRILNSILCALFIFSNINPQSLADGTWAYHLIKLMYPFPSETSYWHDLYEPPLINKMYKGVKTFTVIGVGVSNDSVKFYYDINGKLIKSIEHCYFYAEDDVGLYFYDKIGRMSEITYNGKCWGDNGNTRIEYIYNNENFLIKVNTFKDDNQLTANIYEYDDRGRITKETHYKKNEATNGFYQSHVTGYQIITWKENQGNTRIIDRYDAEGEWINSWVSSYNNEMKKFVRYSSFEHGEWLKDGEILKNIYIFNFDDSNNFLGYERKELGKVRSYMIFNYNEDGLLISSESYYWNSDWGGSLKKRNDFKYKFTFWDK